MNKCSELITKEQKESVYFVTFHKTASSFFSRYILKQVVGLKHIDYAAEIFNGNDIATVSFKEYNCIYGPIRLSLDEGVVYEKVILPLLNKKALYNHKVICFIRDPRDIIVSYFYSQAYSHSFSVDDSIKKLQIKNRKYALEVGIDEYALEKANFIKEKFEILMGIIEENNNLLLLKYEDMIYDFDSFFIRINDFIDLASESKNIIYKNTRPKNNGIHSHRRNGQKNGYKRELEKETIDEINNKLSFILDYFGYKD